MMIDYCIDSKLIVDLPWPLSIVKAELDESSASEEAKLMIVDVMTILD